jgi:hypothetical protein
MSLYGHGSKSGFVFESGAVRKWIKNEKGEWDPDYDPNKYVGQPILMSKVGANGYKISIAYLMQCYSGFKGTVKDEDVGGELNFNWKEGWSTKVMPQRLTTYQGINALGVDLKR